MRSCTRSAALANLWGRSFCASKWPHMRPMRCNGSPAIWAIRLGNNCRGFSRFCSANAALLFVCKAPLARCGERVDVLLPTHAPEVSSSRPLQQASRVIDCVGREMTVQASNATPALVCLRRRSCRAAHRADVPRLTRDQPCSGGGWQIIRSAAVSCGTAR
jgi:hypothetical protein